MYSFSPMEKIHSQKYLKTKITKNDTEYGHKHNSCVCYFFVIGKRKQSSYTCWTKRVSPLKNVGTPKCWAKKDPRTFKMSNRCMS